MVHLDYRDVRPIYSQIADGFRSQITAGVLRPEEKLPSVRELAAELAINPNTIQRAYRELESEGYTVSVPGKGSFVCAAAEAGKLRRRELEGQFVALAGELRALGADDAALMELIKGGETK